MASQLTWSSPQKNTRSPPPTERGQGWSSPELHRARLCERGLTASWEVCVVSLGKGCTTAFEEYSVKVGWCLPKATEEAMPPCWMLSEECRTARVRASISLKADSEATGQAQGTIHSWVGLNTRKTYCEGGACQSQLF